MSNLIRHTDGSPDRRYTFTRECCGYFDPRWVARFAGRWIGSAPTRTDAVRIASEHKAARDVVLAGGMVAS